MKIDKINFTGFIQGHTGYSVLSRSLISLMDYMGIDVRVQDLNNMGIPEFLHLQSKKPDDRFQLLHQIPTVLPMSDGFYTVTEFDEPPYGSISPMRRAKWILTESEFCKNIFSEFTKAPIDVIHYPIDPQFKPNGVKFKFNDVVEKFGFKFLSVFEWLMRKNPYMLIEAFVEEFKPEEDVCLILRSWSKFQNPVKWIGLMAKEHNVFWIPQNLPHLNALYRACNCFVTTTLGEGFGHPIVEAMACGLPVIVPDSTGIKDFCNNKNSYLIPVEEKQVKDTHSYNLAGNEIPHLIQPWFKCWEPNKEELKKAMRKVFKNKGSKFISEQAVKVRDKFSFDSIIKEIEVAFELE
jgi:glycosyltransferase involved in cell wall biosynthesis